jgi:hypothetical protein
MRGTVQKILQWFAGISAALKKPMGHFSRPRYPASDIVAEPRADSAAEEAGAAATATETAAATLTAQAPVIAAITADATTDQDAQVCRVVPFPPHQQEIQRRRELVRTLFNDFWSGRDDKPPAFVDRLNEAETYLNERLVVCGEPWQLDAKTRNMLSLPPRSNRHNKGNGAARPI